MRAACAMLAAVLAARTASADDAQPVGPWSIGVSDAQRATAQQHLEAGNALFLDRKYPEALDEYQQAVAAWNHPAIRFNMVRCLILLEKPLEASDQLKLALEYGAAPFDPSIYAEALAYENLLASEIGQLDVNCDQPGVELTIDGQPLVACPGQSQRRVLPGEHQVVGKKPGYVPRTIEIVVLGGKHEHAAITLEPLSKTARLVHRWPQWLPWVAFGGGVAVLGAGELVHVQASQNLDSYTTQIAQSCMHGCPTTAVDTELRDRALAENDVADAVIVAGAAVAAVGLVMLYLNRGRVAYASPVVEKRGPSAQLDVTPRPGGAVITWSWSH